MRPHPYLRGYLAGIAVPTLFLLVLLAAFAVFRFYVVPIQFDTSSPPRPILGGVLLVESLGRAIIFPMAVVPNLWGVWNMVWVGTKSRTRLPIGVHGSLLVAFIVPAGVLLGRALELFHIQLWYALPAIPVGMIVYYLAWKFLVGLLNQELGIA